MRVVKLTRQYSGHGFFSHRIEFYGRDREMRLRQWIRIRNWLWQQFGPSAEQEFAREGYFDGQQPKWAWDSEKSAIYLKEEALVLFQLRKEFWEDAKNI